MNAKEAILGLAGIALVGILAACGGGGQPAGGSASVDVTTTEYQFTPAAWTVPAGSSVTVNLTNNGSEEHEWVLLKQGTAVTAPFDADDEEKVFWEIEAEAGEGTTGTFSAPAEAGQYTIVCGVAGHFENGMQGTLTVN
jgi:plastocyanin